jgi:pilus assembly protein CpaE
VVIDLPKGWSEMAERLVTLVDEVVVMARPDLASLRNTRMLVDEMVGRRVDGRRPKVVVNFVGAAKKHEYGTADFAESGAAVPSAMIPFDPEPLMAVVAEGLPMARAQGKAMTALLDFADTLFSSDNARQVPKRKKGSLELLGPLKSKLAGLRPKKLKA